MRADYCGLPDDPHYRFDAELVESVILKMKRGKAADLNSITSEHLRFSRCLLSCVLSKLYNFMLRLAHVPHCFGLSYTVSVIKNSMRTTQSPLKAKLIVTVPKKSQQRSRMQCSNTLDNT